MKELYYDERALSEIDDAPEVPQWIDQDISPSQIEAIYEGGCASGAYMPAVTYYTARQTMGEYGDEVLQYLQDELGELPRPRNDKSWSGLALFYLRCAVEAWAASAKYQLERLD